MTSMPTKARPSVVQAGELMKAGADVRVFTFEKAVLPSLRATGRTVAIVNAEGRIVLSNSARHVSGTLLRATDATRHPIGDLPLALVDLA